MKVEWEPEKKVFVIYMTVLLFLTYIPNIDQCEEKNIKVENIVEYTELSHKGRKINDQLTWDIHYLSCWPILWFSVN